MRRIFSYTALSWVIWLSATPYSFATESLNHDVTWPKLPLACLPERATYWSSDSDYTPCHCPPAKTFCPKNNDEWRALMSRPAPPEVVFHCCWPAYIAEHAAH